MVITALYVEHANIEVKEPERKMISCVNEKRSRACIAFRNLERSRIRYFSTNQWIEYDDEAIDALRVVFHWNWSVSLI